MAPEYPALNVSPQTGHETFLRDGQPLDTRLIDFWRWAYSDLANNAQRGILAEYIVACALGVAHGVRREWDACDLTSSSQLRIEVKSASYLQSWSQKKLSNISFSIRPTHSIQEDNVVSPESERQSDIYIFCVLHHKNKTTLDPLNLNQWEFYVLPTRILNENYLERKSIRLSVLMKMNLRVAKFDQLAQCVEEIAGACTLANKEVVIE
jgi:hypothetical protein